MIAADTITDEQIREWESDVLAHGTDAQKRRAVDLATLALAPPLTLALVRGSHHTEIPALRRAEKRRVRARARCAEILNARNNPGITPLGEVKLPPGFKPKPARKEQP